MTNAKPLARTRSAAPAHVLAQSGNRALLMLTNALRAHKARDHEAAERDYRRALELDPNSLIARRGVANLLLNDGRADEAAIHLGHAARIAPDDAEIALEHAFALQRAGQHAEGVAAFRRALARKPENGKALRGLGRSLLALGESGEAIDVLQRAIDAGLEGDDAFTAQAYIADALLKQSRISEAIEAIERAAALAPDSFEIQTLRGMILYQGGHADDGLSALERARELALAAGEAAAGRLPEIDSLIGVALSREGRADEAEEALHRAVEANPDSASANLRLGIHLTTCKDFEKAIPYLETAMALDPDNPRTMHKLYNAKRYICDWSSLEENRERLLAAPIEECTEPVPPGYAMTLGGTRGDQFRFARHFAQTLKIDPKAILAPPPAPDLSRRIRLGYLSHDLRAHATAFLAVELFERHDRTRFEVFAYSYGPNDGSDMYDRLVEAFDHFIDITEMTNAEAARLVREDGIDILIDLKGYTQDARTHILGMRPAPVQVNYLGYPGTMAADYVDYIVADKVIIPPEHVADYHEAVAWLPNTYQPNDSKRIISPDVPTRAACGLPESGVVFAAFHQNYKFTPQMFNLWMRILTAVPGSVLWTLQYNSATRANLRAVAERAGVDPDRLVFAPKLPQEEHLARLSLADLLLDTMPVCSHTTASDALWAGIPLVTVTGDSMVSRVATSILEAAGLPELVTKSLEDYEALVVALARDPDRLAAVTDRLRATVRSSPVFDIERYTRNLERAYIRMAEIAARGERPTTIDVDESDPLPAAPPRSESAKPPRKPAPQALKGGWQTYRDGCCIFIVAPAQERAEDLPEDLAAMLSAAFGELGGSAPLVQRLEDCDGRRPIVFGAERLADDVDLPPRTIIFNTESAVDPDRLPPRYLDRLRRHGVLDCSARSNDALREAGIHHVRHFPVGYAGALTRVSHRAQKDIDVLLLSSAGCARADGSLSSLQAAGLTTLDGRCAGRRDRDELVGRSKIVLSTHTPATAAEDLVRLAWLLSNAACVVCDGEETDEDLAPFGPGVAFTSPGDLAQTCASLAADRARQNELAARGYGLMLQRRQSDILKMLANS